MSHHTPGPWMADLEDACAGEDVTICAPNPSCTHVAAVTTCWPCCEGDYDDQHEEGRANARLIAAAPDLLSACKRVLLIASHSGGNHPILPADAVESIRAAVARAEGGAR